MSMLKTVLTALLAIQGANLSAQSLTAQSAITAFSGPELARAIKTDLESISGPGTVTVSTDGKILFSARIAIPGFSAKICNQIYDREVELRQLFPDLNFDFHFDGPELARAVKANLESISGTGTVDVSIDSQTLLSVRIAVPGFSSEIYNKLYDRELEFYLAFRDLNFDFYLRPAPVL
jgi:hypothetical protein